MKPAAWIAAALAFFSGGVFAAANEAEQPTLIHDFVPHVSTGPVNKGHTVGLYVREKVMPGGTIR